MAPTRTFDLRSDTVTRPTAPMREAMARAEVGDDCYHDDPSVIALEERVASLMGKEAAIFVPSGTMANQLAVHVHARPGEALACAPMAHVQVHEGASAARTSGVQAMPIGERTGYSAAQLRALLDEESCGWPRVGLVWLENTIGAAGAVLWPQAELTAIGELARAEGRPVHLDGARLWNAHVASGLPLASLAAPATTVSVCLSKGLGAPVGSVLSGPRPVIEQVRAARYGFGGSMRQAGVLAAAGQYAIEHQLDRLADDHRHAAAFSEAVADLPCWNASPVATNMALFGVPQEYGAAERLCAPLREAGVIVYPNLFREVRVVFNLHVGDEDMAPLIETTRRVLSAIAPLAA